MIPKETVDRIFDLVKVEEVIGDFVSLRRRGANYVACCPFHDEKTPSFSVSPVKGFYYCFGCHKGGSAVNFLMEHENMSYVEALRYLAKKYNVEIVEEEDDPEKLAARQRAESLYLVSDFAARFFADQLKTPEGHAQGYNYFRSRGMEDATIEKFGLGWAPVNSTALLSAARAAGYKDEYLLELGLEKAGSDGHLWDFFHARAIFPIYSDSGRVIAFGGRTLYSDFKERRIGKYVNSNESAIYVKSRTLYGLYQAKSAIAKADRCILVEGNIDMISMHQIGITNTVASCGTALTVEHIRKIQRFTNNITIIYDGDSAGIHAALRGVGMVLQEGMDVKVVVLPDGKDPDDFCRGNTLERVQAFIRDNEKDFITFKMDLSLVDAGDDPMKRAGVINDIADTIALVPDAVKRAVYVDFCADRLSIDREIVRNRVDETVARLKEERYQRERSKAERAALAQHIADSQTAQAAQQPETGSGVKTAPVRLPGASGTKVVRKSVSPLASVEMRLLDFILNSGLEQMKFASGSRFYVDPPMTVADFIDASLEDDNVVFEDEAYRMTYDEYFRLYDEGLSQEEILRKLVMYDTAVASTVAELTSRRYEVTEKNLKASMTNESTLLLQEVPRAILRYQEKLLEVGETKCRKKMKEPGADIEALLIELQDLSRKRNALKNEMTKI